MRCGHSRRDLGITWPSNDASGVAFVTEAGVVGNSYTVFAGLTGSKEQLANDSDVSGKWFAGAKLNKRSCDGDCSHESFILERVFEPHDQQNHENGKYFNFCKTAYKPYDVAVNICLIIAKHYLKDALFVDSDGSIDQWKDSLAICESVLGYKRDFCLG